MKTFSLATRVDHSTKKHFVEKATALGITLGEYLAYYLEDMRNHEQLIQQLQAEKQTLQEELQQLRQELAQDRQVQAAKSKMQQEIESMLQGNEEILARNYQQQHRVLTKEALQQQGFHFGFTTWLSLHVPPKR